jgi:hypothetical protein
MKLSEVVKQLSEYMKYCGDIEVTAALIVLQNGKFFTDPSGKFLPKKDELTKEDDADWWKTEKEKEED